MKKYLLLILPLLAFMACNDDDDDYSLDKFWVSLATVENPDNEAYFYLRLDNNERLWVGATNYPSYRPRTGQRVLADYTILNDKPESSGYDHDVKLNNAYNILTKDIYEITPATQDSIGNDPVGINDMWIGSDYLNVRFYYPGYNQVHFINLVKDDSKEYTDGKTHLELRHNANNDNGQYRINAMVCFDLSSLLDDAIVNSETLELVIHVKQLDGTDKEYPHTYKFKDNNTTVRDFDRDDFDDITEDNLK